MAAAATNHFLILYASQTGNAKSIAEGLHEEASKKSLNTSVHCVNEFEKEKFPFAEEQNVVFVVSTTGEGDPPDHALKYWRKMKKKTLPNDYLRHIRYTLLGVCLGDTNYTNFCNMGKMLDKRLRELGAVPFYDPGFADDGTGLEIVVEPWIEGLWPAMRLLTDGVTLPKENLSKEESKESSFVPVEEASEGAGKEKSSSSLKEATSVKEEMSLPPLTTVTSSPTSSRKKGEDVITKLANKPAVKAAMGSGPISSPKASFVPRVNPLAVTKLSPLNSPGLKHLERPDPGLISSGPTPSSISSVGSNQIWTGYRKGALKPIEGKLNEMTLDSDNGEMGIEDLVASSTSKTLLTPLEGRIRSVSLSGSNMPCVEDVGMEGARSSPNLCQSVKAEELNHSTVTNFRTEDADITGPFSGNNHVDDSVVIETGIQESTTVNMGNSPSQPKVGVSEPLPSNSKPSLLIEQLRSLSCDVAQSLTLPSKHHPYLEVELQGSTSPTPPSVPCYPYHSLSYGPGTRSFTAVLKGNRVLTSPEAAKITLEMTFDVKEDDFTYEPGDAFGFICPNRPEEVDAVLHRLHLSEVENRTVHLTLQHGTQAKKPALPKHIPQGCTVRQFFTHCCDLRGIPKKGFLFMLAGFASNPLERRRLEELASRQGAGDYTKLFIEHHFDFIDVLAAFPSCQPSLQCLLENMPRLQPRYYSAASSPLEDRQRFKIVFNLTVLPNRELNQERRLGLCTSWLCDLCESEEPVEIAIFTRGVNPFHLPPDLATPIIMCGPGTGVSPFLGFIEHFSHLHGNVDLGESWLFYGCRHPEKDHLYKEDFSRAVDDGVLGHYLTSYSRSEASDVCYVQDNLRKHGEHLSHLIMKMNAVVYVCGDAKDMSKNIRDAFFDILSQYLKKEDLPSASADKILIKMRENRRYILDLWG